MPVLPDVKQTFLKRLTVLDRRRVKSGTPNHTYARLSIPQFKPEVAEAFTQESITARHPASSPVRLQESRILRIPMQWSDPKRIFTIGDRRDSIREC